MGVKKRRTSGVQVEVVVDEWYRAMEEM